MRIAIIAPPWLPLPPPAYGGTEAVLDALATGLQAMGTAQGTAIAAVIHHGIDTAAHQAGAGRGGYALLLGRMTPEKGIHIAARVARAAGLPLRIAGLTRRPLHAPSTSTSRPLR